VIEYVTVTADAKQLTEHADAGWTLKHVLHSYVDAHGLVTMLVLLSKTEPDNLSGLMIDVDKPKPKPRGRPRKDAS
jgi:hypothetical protein